MALKKSTFKRQKAKGENDGGDIATTHTDMMSSLPDSIMCHILSSLQTRTSVATMSLVSLAGGATFGRIYMSSTSPTTHTKTTTIRKCLLDLHFSWTPCYPSVELATFESFISAVACWLVINFAATVSTCGSVLPFLLNLKSCLSRFHTAFKTNVCSFLILSWIAQISFLSGNNI
jgi:hypothetical protein